MNKQEIESFWRDKEIKCQSTLIIASAAQYITGYVESPGPVPGLLYIMKNGIYFENFEKDHWIDNVFRIKTEFTPVFFHLKNEFITDVSCFKGQKNKFKIPFSKQLAFIIGLLPQHLIVEYRIENNTSEVRFACAESPLALCAAYYKEHGISVR